MTDQDFLKDYSDGVWIIYDGECPICHMATHAYRLKQEYGALHLVDARDTSKNTKLLDAVNNRQFDLDEGMVIFQKGTFYHGHEAVWFMARFGDRKNFFSLLCMILFRSKVIAKISYPFLRLGRNTLLWLRGKSKINNLKR